MPALSDFLSTIIGAGALLALVALALAGDAIVWQFGAFRTFKARVRNIAQTIIKRVRGKSEVNLAFNDVARWRVEEIFETSSTEHSQLLHACGAIFFEENAFDDVMGEIKRNSGFVLLSLAIGMIYILAVDQNARDLVQAAGPWELTRVLTEQLMRHHFVLVAELFVLSFQITFLMQVAALLRKISRQLR